MGERIDTPREPIKAVQPSELEEKFGKSSEDSESYEFTLVDDDFLLSMDELIEAVRAMARDKKQSKEVNIIWNSIKIQYPDRGEEIDKVMEGLMGKEFTKALAMETIFKLHRIEQKYRGKEDEA